MIKIVAENIVIEGKTDEFLAIAKELVAKSRAEEGNISYTLNQNIKKPNVLTFIEIWKDKEAIESHNASEHFNSALPKLQAICEGGSIELYTEVIG